jgi:hypothetical protein
VIIIWLVIKLLDAFKESMFSKVGMLVGDILCKLFVGFFEEKSWNERVVRCCVSFPKSFVVSKSINMPHWLDLIHLWNTLNPHACTASVSSGEIRTYMHRCWALGDGYASEIV